MALLATLAALLLTSLQSAQAKARRIHCSSNLRQLTMALLLYVDDTASFPVALNTDGLGDWQVMLKAYNVGQIFYCPQLIPAADDFLRYFPSNQFIFPHYGYNVYGALRINPPPQNPGLGGNWIWTGPGVGNFVAAPGTWAASPSQMIALGDAFTFFTPPEPSPTLTPDDPLYSVFPYILQPQGYPGVDNSHANGAVITFCDGHVEFGPQSQWLSAADTNKRLWNHDNQSHPEFQ